MISAAIIHAGGKPERSALVAKMLDALPQALVAFDTDGRGDHRIANRRGCWPMAEKAWRLGLRAPAAATHHLVLEDDAALCDQFARRLDEAVSVKPDAVISLFLGERWCSVATVMPRHVIAQWLAWSEDEARIRPHHDQIIVLGCMALGIEQVWCSPSLVDHADVPSLLGHPPVTAHRVAGPNDVVEFVQPRWLAYFNTPPVSPSVTVTHTDQAEGGGGQLSSAFA